MATDLVREVLQDMRSPLYRNAIFLVANTALVAGAGFLFWFIVAKLYTEHEVGQALVLVGVATFLATLAQLGFGTGLIRFLPGTKRNRGRMINSCLTLSSILSVIFAAVMLFSVDLWFPQAGELARLSALALVFLLMVPLQANAIIVNNAFVAGREASYVVLKSILYQSARVLTPVLLVGILGFLGILSAFVIGQVLALSIAFFIWLPKVFPEFRPGPALDKTVVNDIIHFSLGNHVAEVLAALPYPVILIIIANLLGSPEAAYFGYPWLIASLLFAVPLMTGVSLYAEGSHFEERLRKDLVRALRFLVPLLFLGILFIWFLGGSILTLIGASYAAEGTSLLRILALSTIFVAVNHIFLSVARVKKWIRVIIALMAYITLGTIGISYWAIPVFGIDGAGIAWLIAQGTAATAIVGFFILKRQAFSILRGGEA